jgi:hypothetical protein
MAPVLPSVKWETMGAALHRAYVVECAGALVVQQVHDLCPVRDPAPVYDPELRSDAARRERPAAAAWGQFVEQHPEPTALVWDELRAAT